MTHKKRDCLERPRKIGAKFTNSNFAPDEFVQPNLSLSFDGKRDRWNGYDNFAHQEVVEEFQKLEAAGIVCLSDSPWVLPLHMVPKLDSSWQLCGNYH